MKWLKSYKLFESSEEQKYLELSKLLQSEIFDDMDIYYYDTEESGEWDDNKNFDFWEWQWDFEGEKRGINVRIPDGSKQNRLIVKLNEYKSSFENELGIKIHFYNSQNNNYIIITLLEV
jgi:hypothetical protein